MYFYGLDEAERWCQITPDPEMFMTSRRVYVEQKGELIPLSLRLREWGAVGIP